jgi:AraC-like DNA-binding protein
MPEFAPAADYARQVQLIMAFAGPTPVARAGWARCQARAWVLDYLRHGRQQQRIGDGPLFTREAQVAALYAPGTVYHELREGTAPLDEAWIVFAAEGEAERALRGLTGEAGYCHLHDPECLLGDRLAATGDAVLLRPPGYLFRVPALVLELLALCITSLPLAGQRRLVRASPSDAADDSLPARVERHVREHLERPLQVADLAAHVGMSPSAFAHLYPRLAGESPYQTILRLKLAQAKVLLVQQGLSVKQTAAELGFGHEFNFSRAFRRQEGVSPRQFLHAIRRRTG